jgi:hypothetical protein
MAMNHLGLFRDQVEVEHRVTWEDIVMASAGRRAERAELRDLSLSVAIWS